MDIKVTLPQHSYVLNIEKGLLDNIGSWASNLWSTRQIVVITDETVEALYGKKVVDSLTASGFDTSMIAVPAGEPSKSLATAEKLYDFLADKGMTRKDGIVALGGGVIGDLAGFVASTFMRGIQFLQVPTTLLAQVDSSIGGKTAVNTTRAKNLVGTFAQPDGVLIDPNTLQTLEPRRVREGIAEIVKYAAIADKDLWNKLASLKDEQELVDNAESIIAACCEVKRKVVEEDELDTGIRLILNFGHTIGHALEHYAGYGVVTHGEGVAIGMVQMNRKAEEKGLTPAGTTVELVEMLEKFGLPIDYSDWNEVQLFEALTHDKKTQGSKIRIIQLEEIGKAKIVPIETTEMKEYLKK